MARPRIEGTLRVSDKGTATVQKFGRTAKREARTTAGEFRRVDRSLTGVGRSAGAVRRQMTGLFAGVSAALAARAAIRSLIDFETGLVGVGKTTNIEGQALKRLGKDFIALSTQIPASTAKLLEIGQAAGQVGVSGSANILRFTETVTKLGSATDLAGAEAATTLARLLNVTGESARTVDRLGASLVALGNTTAATEREIAIMGTAVAQNTAIFDVTAQQAVGVAAAMAAMGIQSEIGGTAIGRAMRTMDAAVREQGESLRVLAEVTGLTGEQFTKVYRDDAVAALQAFFVGLGNVIARGEDATATLEKLGLSDVRLLRVLPVLAKRHEEVTRALDTSIRGYRENTALNEEYDRAAATLGSRLTVLGNTVSAVVLQQRESTGATAEWVDTASNTIAILGGVASASQRADKAARNLADGIEAVTLAAGAFVAARGAFALGSFAATAAMAINPITLAAGAIAVTTGALALLVPKAEEAKDVLEGLQGKITDLGTAARTLGRIRVALGRAEELGDYQEAALQARLEVEALKGASVSLREDLGRVGQSVGAIKQLRREAVRAQQTGEGAATAWERLQIALNTTSRTLDELVTLAPKLNAGALKASIVDQMRTSLEQAGQEPQKLRVLLGEINLDPGTALGRDLTRFMSLVDRQLAGETAGFTNLAKAIRDKFAAVLADPALDAALRVPLSKVIESIEADIVRAGSRLDEYKKTAGDQPLTAGGSADEIQKVTSAVLKQVNALRQQGDLLKIEAEHGRTAADAASFYFAAVEEGLPLRHEHIQAIKDEIEAQEALNKQIEHQRKMEDDPRYAAKYKDPSRAGGFGFAAKQFIDEAQDPFIMGERMAGDTAQTMARSFDTFFFDVIEGKFDSFGDAMRGLGATIGMNFAQAMMRELSNQLSAMAMRGIMQLVGSLFGGGGSVPGIGEVGSPYAGPPLPKARGGVFAGGVDAFASGAMFANRHIAAFASGGVPETSSRYRGIVDQATLFAMAGGRLGVMGEAGPEVVMPAKRHGAGYAIHAEMGGRKALLELGRITGGILGVRLGTRAGAPMGPAQPYASGAVFDAGMASATGRAYSEPVAASPGGGVTVHTPINITIHNPSDGKDVQAGLDKALPKLRKEIERTAKQVFQRQRINERSRSMIAAMSRSR